MFQGLHYLYFYSDSPICQLGIFLPEELLIHSLGETLPHTG